MKTYDAILRVPKFVAPEVGRRALGQIFEDTLTTGNHPFPDGLDVLTSRVEGIEGDIMRTLSGTRYKLELVDAL